MKAYYNETIALKSMSNIISVMNHEEAYIEWVNALGCRPEHLTEEEYVELASDKEERQRLERKFVVIMKTYGKYGFFYG